MRSVQESATVSGISSALANGDEDAALEATGVENLEDDLTGPLIGGLVGSLIQGADLARTELPPTVPTTSVDLLDRNIQGFIRTEGARQVSQISTNSRNAIRGIISDSIENGTSPQRAASLIKKVIGLTVPQQRALMRLSEALEAEGTPRASIERTLSRRANQMLDERAFAIARQETFNAVAGGRQRYWEQLVEQGDLDPGTQRKWITAQDEFVCPVCRPMHNQIRGLTDPFEKGLGGTTLTSPAHVTCRCSVILINPRKP